MIPGTRTNTPTQALPLAACWLLAAFTLSAQAPAKQPKVRPVFENERVRVLEVVWEPGASVPATRLKGEDLGIAGVVIRGATVEHIQADGKKVRHERRVGDVLWESGTAQLEARQNVGKTNMHMIQVRFKKAAPTRAYTVPLNGTKKVLENTRVAVFDLTFAPGAKTALHKYAPRLWVVLDGGRLRSTDKEGKKQEAVVQPAQVMWLPAQEHSLENTGTNPVRAISLELK